MDIGCLLWLQALVHCFIHTIEECSSSCSIQHFSGDVDFGSGVVRGEQFNNLPSFANEGKA